MPETIGLSGTWSVSSPTNGPGKFTFNEDNSGTYELKGEQGKIVFYWWSSTNAFWMQISNGVAGWMEIIEGSLNSETSGSGKIVVAEQGQAQITIVTFTMTKD